MVPETGAGFFFEHTTFSGSPEQLVQGSSGWFCVHMRDFLGVFVCPFSWLNLSPLSSER